MQIEFLKEEIDLRMESLKIELNNLSIKFKKSLDLKKQLLQE